MVLGSLVENKLVRCIYSFTANIPCFPSVSSSSEELSESSVVSCCELSSWLIMMLFISSSSSESKLVESSLVDHLAMGRKNFELAYIEDDKRRKATLRRRVKGLFNKYLLWSPSLCNYFSPNDARPQVWPSTLGVQSVLAKFYEVSDFDQTKSMLNQESFLMEKLQKAKNKLRQQKFKNRQKEIAHLKSRFFAGEPVDHLKLC
ncbi:hypothetical protein RJ641_016512 [Dillenia turbinata]|uniref:MADS-box domain-containing protein n=1 Tax=Dillenia turbinata TaxID=194707 RepID=A0AAN8YZN4_9MAGN